MDSLSATVSARLRLPRAVSSPLSIARSSNCWLIHLTRRLLQPSHTASLGVAKVHLVFRRLHSQQLWVPLRTFRRLSGVGICLFLIPALASDIFVLLTRVCECKDKIGSVKRGEDAGKNHSGIGELGTEALVALQLLSVPGYC